MKVEPYLNFNGRCEEALEFYKKAIGATVPVLMRFKDAPDPSMCPKGGGEKVLHCNFRVGESVLMASDGDMSGPAEFKGVTLTLETANDAEAQRHFNALADGGKVAMPLTKTFFSSQFGMLSDRFGVRWIVLVRQ
jgi:PhnB protein